MKTTVQFKPTGSATLAALLFALATPAAELQLYFSALQRILADQIFTQDGRLYVKNSASNKCNFAYLEKPAVSGADGRLIVRARFSGRSSQNFFGRCIGLGDSFDVLIRAVPQYRDGALALRDVHVDSPERDSFYIRLVRAAMADSLSRSFRYSMAPAAKRILEEPNPTAPFRRELRGFDIREIRVLPDSLVLVLDFQLAVK